MNVESRILPHRAWYSWRAAVMLPPQTSGHSADHSKLRGSLIQNAEWTMNSLLLRSSTGRSRLRKAFRLVYIQNRSLHLAPSFLSDDYVNRPVDLKEVNNVMQAAQQAGLLRFVEVAGHGSFDI